MPAWSSPSKLRCTTRSSNNASTSVEPLLRLTHHCVVREWMSRLPAQSLPQLLATDTRESFYKRPQPRSAGVLRNERTRLAHVDEHVGEPGGIFEVRGECVCNALRGVTSNTIAPVLRHQNLFARG